MRLRSSLLDPRAVGAGAVLAIVIALPAALVGEAAADGDDDPSALVLLCFVVVLAAFVAGGYLAARRAVDAPYSNGAVAALTGFALIQLGGVIANLLQDDPVEMASIAFSALLAIASGLVGALLAMRRPTTHA
jgi:putative membrane protein (TIGR04086 family)